MRAEGARGQRKAGAERDEAEHLVAGRAGAAANADTATWKKLGGQVTGSFSVPPDQTSYLPEVRKVIASDPQVIFIQTDAPTGAVLFRDFKELDNLAIPASTATNTRSAC